MKKIMILAGLLVNHLSVIANGKGECNDMVNVEQISIEETQKNFLFELKTNYTETGIIFKYGPAHKNYRIIQWNQVESVYIRDFNRVREYGSNGIRWTPWGGKGYIASGTTGVQLVLKNGKKVLFSTNKPEELEVFLNELSAKGIINVKH